MAVAGRIYITFIELKFCTHIPTSEFRIQLGLFFSHCYCNYVMNLLPCCRGCTRVSQLHPSVPSSFNLTSDRPATMFLASRMAWINYITVNV
jgi:hypothetical protein